MEELTKLGLLESESKVYLALLELGASSAGEIAKKTKLNRGSVYKALGVLIDKGLVSSVIKANRKEFEASNPIIVRKLIESKEKELEEIKKKIPLLIESYKSVKKRVETNIYEGIIGAKAIWENLLEEARTGDYWLILGAPKSAELFGGYFKDFNERRAKKRVNMKIIYNENAKDLIEIRKKQKLTEVKVMPEEYITPASIEIIDDKTLIVIYEPQIFVFSINNKEVANSFKQYFDMLWKIAKKV